MVVWWLPQQDGSRFKSLCMFHTCGFSKGGGSPPSFKVYVSVQFLFIYIAQNHNQCHLKALQRAQFKPVLIQFNVIQS